MWKHKTSNSSTSRIPLILHVVIFKQCIKVNLRIWASNDQWDLFHWVLSLWKAITCLPILGNNYSPSWLCCLGQQNVALHRKFSIVKLYQAPKNMIDNILRRLQGQQSLRSNHLKFHCLLWLGNELVPPYKDQQQLLNLAIGEWFKHMNIDNISVSSELSYWLYILSYHIFWLSLLPSFWWYGSHTYLKEYYQNHHY